MEPVDPRIDPALVPAGSRAVVFAEHQPEYAPLPSVRTLDDWLALVHIAALSRPPTGSPPQRQEDKDDFDRQDRPQSGNGR